MPARTLLVAVMVVTGCPADESADDGSGEAAGSGEPEYACTPEDGLTMYEQRIAPLLTDDRPSTCNQCHLSGIDLSVFVQQTPCQTMACMAELGLVDLLNPASSLVLRWIERAEPDGGITAETIATEHDAVLEWIEMSAVCGEQMCEPVVDPCGTPAQEILECEIPPSAADEQRPVDDDGTCSDLNLERLWQDKVYSWRGRCFPCHFDSFDEDFEEPPPWITSGDCNLGALQTLRTAQRSGYLDTADPMASLLLTKPLEEELGGVEHGGGPKMHSVEEAAYLDFVEFLERYASCKSTAD